MTRDIILEIYKDIGKVYRFNDIAMLVSETNFQSLSKKLNKFMHMGKLLNPRKGIYAKSNFNPEELACILYTPSYISLEYVLQKAGVVFQYDSRITSISYLSREIEVGNQTYSYRKIKGEILIEPMGIIRKNTRINIAAPERAFLDTLYLDKNYYFDNLNPLNKELIYKLLPVYKSKAMTVRVAKLLEMIDINKHKFFMVQLLMDIYSDIELANYLGFKGGTALMFFYELLGELMDNGMKKFVRTKLRTEIIVLLKFYKNFPLFS